MSKFNTWANVLVVNAFGTSIYNVLVKHRYDEDLFEQHSWSRVGHGEQSSEFKIGYWTGFGRTGHDYWWIQFEAYGKIWNCKSNFYCFLTADDAKKTVKLRLYIKDHVAHMDMDCPKSSNCTVQLTASENNRPDLSGWMEQNLPALQSRKLVEIALPGSHDAGMYKAHKCTLAGIGGPTDCNTRTQGYGFAHQLACGIRYFDLRIVYDGSLFHTGHFDDVKFLVDLGFMGCLGGSLDEILKDVAVFANVHPNELVILCFSHYLTRDTSEKGWGFSGKIKKKLTEHVISIIGSHMVKGSDGTNLLDLTLSEIMKMGSVVTYFEDIQTDFPAGILGFNKKKDVKIGPLPIYDSYSNTNDFKKMKSNQLEKLNTQGGNPAQLFLLSWTLTLSDPQAGTCMIPSELIEFLIFGPAAVFLPPLGFEAPSIEYIARVANANQQQVLDHLKVEVKLFNILLTDYCDTFATRICMEANGLK